MFFKCVFMVFAYNYVSICHTCEMLSLHLSVCGSELISCVCVCVLTSEYVYPQEDIVRACACLICAGLAVQPM